MTIMMALPVVVNHGSKVFWFWADLVAFLWQGFAAEQFFFYILGTKISRVLDHVNKFCTVSDFTIFHPYNNSYQIVLLFPENQAKHNSTST